MLLTLDVAKLTLDGTLQKVGSASSLDSVSALCRAHNIESGDKNKDRMGECLFEHLTNGKRAGNRAPGCEKLGAEVGSPINKTILHRSQC